MKLQDLFEAKSAKGSLSDRQLKSVIRSAAMGQRIIADGKTVWPGQETTVVNSNKGKMAWANKGEAFTQKMKDGKFNKVVIKAYSKNGPGYSWLTDEEFDTSTLNEAKGEYNSFKAWKAAIKKKHPDAWIDGDADIATALVGPKPYVRGETKGVGEWDGAVGELYEAMAKTGSRIHFNNYAHWKKSLPPKSTFHKDGKIERAQALGKELEGVAGQWNGDDGWIYEYYLDKANLQG